MFFRIFPPFSSLQEEIDVVMIKNVGAFDDHDGNVLLPVCFSHHWQQDFSEKVDRRGMLVSIDRSSVFFSLFWFWF